MKYFKFDLLNSITNFFNNSSLEDQIYSYQNWFNFKAVYEKESWTEETILFVIIIYLVYIWHKLLTEYFKT